MLNSWTKNKKTNQINKFEGGTILYLFIKKKKSVLTVGLNWMVRNLYNHCQFAMITFRISSLRVIIDGSLTKSISEVQLVRKKSPIRPI